MAASPYGPWEPSNCLEALAAGGTRAGRTGQVELPCNHAQAQSSTFVHHLVRRLFAGVNQALGPGLWFLFLFCVA